MTGDDHLHDDDPRLERALHVALVAPEIPWNTGNVGRTCLAMGAQLHLVRPLGFRLDGKHLRRAGVDYWDSVDPVLWPSWPAFEEALPRIGTPVLLTAEGEQDLGSAPLPRPCVLVLGCESRGLPADVRERFAAQQRAIPMPGGAATGGAVRSLNLSTAAGMALYEVRRRWRDRAPGG